MTFRKLNLYDLTKEMVRNFVVVHPKEDISNENN